MEDIIKSVILGILEGVTEFLPISSTGHLIIGTQLLKFRMDSPQFQSAFEIFIQIGAIVAVLIFYARELLQQASTIHKDQKVQRWWLAIVVAAIPGLAMGFLFASKIEEALFRPSVVAVSMIVGGVFIYAAEVYQSRRAATPATSPSAAAPTVPSLPQEEVTLVQALVIGLFQILALIPGMSRSAMSIIGGMFAGVSRQTATRFSFYLALPVLGSATLYALIKHLSDLNNNSGDLVLLLVGAVVSGIVAWAVISWLLRYVARNSFVPFAVYRIFVGVLILVLVAMGLLK